MIFSGNVIVMGLAKLAIYPKILGKE